MKFYSLIAGFLLILSGSVLRAEITSESFVEKGASNFSWSHAHHLAYGLYEQPGLYVENLVTGDAVKLCDIRGAAYRASWSADGRYLAFKYLIRSGDKILQAPAVFDSETYQLRLLHQPAVRAGIPSWLPGNALVFTIGKVLYHTQIDGVVEKQYTLPAYANQTPVSPDGRYVVYNDRDDRLFLLDLFNGSSKKAGLPPGGYFEPQWSPSGDRLLCSSLSGDLYVYRLEDGQYITPGKGTSARWSADGERIYFSQAISPHEGRLEGMRLMSASHDGKHVIELLGMESWCSDFAISPDGKGMIFNDLHTGDITRCDLKATDASIQPDRFVPLKFHEAIDIEPRNAPDSPIMKSMETSEEEERYFDIPYLNQVYDPPGWFNGFSACGGTSAVMCLGYYGILEQWPLNLSKPLRHRPDYSHYICEIYTYNDYTFDIPGKDPSGNYGYGAFGYIIQNNWADTKGNMAKYARKHGLESTVDWDETRGKAIIEIDNRHPFVLLNSLTQSGHYISVIGYENDATTLIVNDPYGNKNNGYYSYYGRRVRYDWPGYNNGYSSLNTVWCFIYFRGALPADLHISGTYTSSDTLMANQSAQIMATVKNIGNKSTPPSTGHISVNTYAAYADNLYLLEEFAIPALGASDSVDLALEITVPDTFQSNHYYVGIYADSDSIIGEMLEDNNYSASLVTMIGYPRVYSLYPKPGTTLSNNTTSITARYQDLICGIDADDVQLFLDGEDVTAACTNVYHLLKYNPVTPLSDGLHTAKIRVKNEYGFQTAESWSFSIETQTALVADHSGRPAAFELFQNFPNPFNGQTRIRFNIPDAGPVDLSVYDLSGNNIAVLNKGYLNAGAHICYWNGTNAAGKPIATGIYIIRLSTPGSSQVRRMVYTK